MHFFNIATNITRGPFIIGYEEDPNNFYLKGETVGGKPQVSCRIFDSEGRFLFSMARNRFSSKGEVESRIKQEEDRLLVLDDEGHIILKLETRNERGKRVTYIQGQFFDKDGRLAARGDERGLIVNCPLRM